MVQAIASPFIWKDGKPRSPQEVAREQKIAEALMTAQPQAQGFWGALGQVGSAASGSLLNSRADASEAQGREAASALFSGLGSGASTDSIAAALMDPSAAWATPGQAGVAEALLNNNLRQEDPGYQLDLQLKQAQINSANNPALAGSTLPSNVQEWQYYSSLPPDQQSQYLTMKRSNSPLNIGTGFVTQDPANPGQVLGGPIAIDNQTPAYDTATGTANGKTDAENAALFQSVQSKMPGLRSTIDTLTSLADTATYTLGGQVMDDVKRQMGLPVGQGAIDRSSYIAIVDNQVLPLLRDTFGAAFTVQEGASLRATLGDPNKSPPEKKAILDAFIEQKERDVAAMQRRLPVGSSSIPAEAAPAPQVRVFNPTTGRLE